MDQLQSLPANIPTQRQYPAAMPAAPQPPPRRETALLRVKNRNLPSAASWRQRICQPVTVCSGVARQLLCALPSRPVNNDETKQIHLAPARRHIRRAQHIAHRLAIQRVITLSTFRLAGCNDATPVLSRQLVSSRPAGTATT